MKLVSDGFQVAMGELVNNQENMKLRDFVIGAEEKVKQLKETLKMAEETFHKAVKFFGEDTKGTQPGPFFTEFDRLVVAYKVILDHLNVHSFSIWSTYIRCGV